MTWSGFPDAALEAASSRGLLRRAARDLEAGLVRLRAWDGLHAEVEVDGAVVTLVPGGIREARCTCPSREVCRHRLAAALLLRDLPPAGEAPPLADPVAEIRALDDAALQKALGRTALRDGARLLAEGPVDVAVDGAVCRIRIPDQPEVAFVAGGGIAGMVSRAPPARARILHAAALLAVRGGVAAAATDAAPADAAVPPDLVFLSAVRAALRDAARSALGPAPRALEDRLLDLAVSSRADSLPALASLLRQAAGQVARRRKRDPAWGPAVALNTLARAAALAEALGTRNGAELRGTVRQAFEPLAGPLDLVGCGVEVWRAASGARGATAHLYSPGLDRWFGATLARAAGQDPFFDPVAAARHGGGAWGQHLAEIGRSRVRLTGAEASANGRLSLRQGTSAAMAPLCLGEDEVAGWPDLFRDWDRLEDALADWFGPSLAAGGRGARPVILWPEAFGRPGLDELSQQLVLPVRDARGRWIGLTADVDGRCAATLPAAKAPPVQLVFATASAAGGRYLLRPHAATAGDTATPVSFALEPDRRRAEAPALPRVSWAAVPGATAALLAAVLDEMVRQCELGGRLQDPGLSARLAALIRRADDAGLAPLGRILARIDVMEAARVDAILAAVHVTASLATLTCRLPCLS